MAYIFFGRLYGAVFVSIDRVANFHYNRFSIFNDRKPACKDRHSELKDRVSVRNGLAKDRQG